MIKFYFGIVMINKLYWQATTNENRNKSIEDIKEIIMKYDGCIMHFNLFSDLAMSLSVETEENKIIELHEALSDRFEINSLNQKIINLKSNKEWLILINLSFSSGKGNLKNTIPNFPG